MAETKKRWWEQLSFRRKKSGSESPKSDKKRRWGIPLNWQQWVVLFMWVFTLCGLGAVASLFIMAKNESGLFKDMPMPTFEELENPQTNLATQIFSADGELIGTYFIENRTSLSYEELFPADRSKWLKIDGHELPPIVAALLATEDVRFFDHSGIDFQATARAGIKTVLMGQGEQGGGSTITQQLAKNLYKTRQNASTSSNGKAGTVAAKIQEYVIATQLEYSYTKEEIIAMYLNTVEFSNSNFGIKSAANNFFGKEPRDLNIEEAALIAGQVKAPGTYAIVRNGKPNEKAKERRNLVLRRMAEAGAISEDRAAALSKLPIDLSNYRRADEAHNEGSATYFREMVRRTMTATEPQEPVRDNYKTKAAYNEAMRRYQIDKEEWDTNPLLGWCNKNTKPNGEPYNIYSDGLRIYTTLDTRMQQYAEEATREHMSEVVQPRFLSQAKRRKTAYVDLTDAQIEAKIKRSMKDSERWSRMAAQGYSEEQIEASFNTPVDMEIFTYEGVRDTVLTPRDSILHNKSIMRSAFVAVDPRTGYVRAYVGGPDYRFFKYDGAQKGKRQVGSTAKPFIYTFAIDQLKLTPCHPVPNLPVTIETPAGPWSPKEAGSNVQYTGVHPLYWGLANSRNNHSAWIMKEANNPEVVAEFIHRLGINSYIDPVVSLCLGSYESNPYEMAAAYCTFANQGKRVSPIVVTRIEDSHGNILAEFKPKTQNVLSADVAYTMITMMERVITMGTGGRMRYEFKFNDVEMAAKTGTTNDNVDAWFMCVLPNLVMGSWVGGEENSIHLTREADGSRLALPITGKFLTKVYENGTLGVSRTDKFERSPNVPSYDCPVDMEEENGVGSTTSIGDSFFDI